MKKKVLSGVLAVLLILMSMPLHSIYAEDTGSSDLLYNPTTLFANASEEHTTRFDASDTLVVTFFDSTEGFVEFTLNGVPIGNYTLFVTSKDASSRGIFDVYVNDRLVAEHDQRGSGYTEHELTVVHLNEGDNQIKFEVNDSSPSTIGLYEGTFSQIRLAPFDGEIPVYKLSLSYQLAQAKAITPDGYTEVSYNNLQTTIAEAETIYNNDAVTQIEVDDAVQAIVTAIDNLVPDVKYTINITTIDDATITTIPENEAFVGEEVKINIDITNGDKMLEDLIVMSGGSEITLDNSGDYYTFIMPENPVEISATLNNIPTYDVHVTDVEGVTINAVPSTNVKEGETVTLSIDLTDSTKIVDYISTSPQSIDIAINNTFIMPDTDVTIEAVLKNKEELPSYIEETDTKIIVRRDNYTVDIDKEGFKYQFEKPDGTIIAPRHDTSGIRFAKEGTALANITTTSVIHADINTLYTEIATTENTKAKVNIHFLDRYARFEIIPYNIVSDEEETEVDNQWYSSTGEPAFFISNQDIVADEYSVTVEQNFSSRDSKFGAGPVVGYTDANNFINVRAIYKQADANKLQFLVRKNGSYTKLDFDDSIGVNSDIVVNVKGNIVEAYVDDIKIGEYDNGSSVTGKVGYRSYKVNTVLDNYIVTSGGNKILEENFDDLDNVDFTVTEREWIDPSSSIGDNFVIEARTKGLGEDNNAPVYGLGDYGGWGSNANIFGKTFDKISNNGHGNRFISTFTVFPSESFAQVLFETRSKRAEFNASSNMLGVNDSIDVNSLYYFLGDDIKTIYQDYKNVRTSEGYLDSKPHYEMFGVGFEAYGALHWNADEAGVQDYISRYLDEGFNITWGVIGSGFWKGDRNNANEGATTSFGIWDDEAEAGRTDGLANPRFPNAPSFDEILNNAKIIKPGSSQDFFKNNNIKLLLGLRNGFKADPSLGGNYKEEHDGPYMQQGLDNDYFLRGDDGEVILSTGLFPKGKFYLLDSYNNDALDWYEAGTDLWNVDGFKEDAMLEIYDNNDANWNNVNERLTKDEPGDEGDFMIIRNSAYSVPGDILRINDTSQNDPSRITVNQMAYAASGYGNVYPDIIGANYSPAISTKYNNYLTRNAIAASVMPSLSLGRGAWDMENEENENAVLKALGWHSDYAPYIYDAVLDGYETGYPYAYTPLFLAYPENDKTYNRIDKSQGTYEWLLGESILAAPIFDNATSSASSGNMATTRNIYLPEGKWMDYETGQIYQGEQELIDFSLPIDKTPVFVGGKGILISENWRDNDRTDKDEIFAEVFPVTPEGSTYDFTYPDGQSKSVITTHIPEGDWASDTIVVTNETDNTIQTYEVNANNDSIKFQIIEGNNYSVTVESSGLNKNTINENINRAERIIVEEYTTESINELNSALENAKSVVQTATTQEEIDAANSWLANALASLVEKEVENVFDIQVETENLSNGSDARINVTLNNITEETKNGTLIIALYDDNSKMIALNYLRKNIGAGDAENLGAGFTIPTVGIYSVKVFVADDLEQLNILSDILEFEVTQ